MQYLMWDDRRSLWVHNIPDLKTLHCKQLLLVTNKEKQAEIGTEIE